MGATAGDSAPNARLSAPWVHRLLLLGAMLAIFQQITGIGTIVYVPTVLPSFCMSTLTAVQVSECFYRDNVRAVFIMKAVPNRYAVPLRSATKAVIAALAKDSHCAPSAVEFMRRTCPSVCVHQHSARSDPPHLLNRGDPGSSGSSIAHTVGPVGTGCEQSDRVV